MARRERDRPEDEPVAQGGTYVNGPLIRGDSGGIHVGGHLEVTSTVSGSLSVTQRQRRSVYKVLDAAEADVRWKEPERASLLRELTEAADADEVEPGTLTTLLDRIVRYADPASAVLAAAQLASTVLSG